MLSVETPPSDGLFDVGIVRLTAVSDSEQRPEVSEIGNENSGPPQESIITYNRHKVLVGKCPSGNQYDGSNSAVT